MTAPSISTLPIAAFGDPSAGVWGVVVGGADPAIVVGVLDDSSEPRFEPATLEDASEPRFEPSALEDSAAKPAPKPGWTLAGAEHNLRITPVPAQLGTPGLAGELETCRISGTIALGGRQRELDCAGVRCGAAGQVDSLRLVATFFERDIEIALLATRPPGAKGQDRDAVAAIVRGEPAVVLNVFDPRLSTTYRADGNPSRMGIELWLGATEEDDLYPRRAAGEATSSHAVLRRSGTRLDAQAMCCRSRGLDGAGVYVIARHDGV